MLDSKSNVGFAIKSVFFPDKWRNLLELSASALCSFSLAEAKQKSENVCVRCKTTDFICTGGRAGSSRENGISPWNTGVTPAVLCQRELGRNCSPSPFNTDN